MKTLLALLLHSGIAGAVCMPCEMPIPPVPCVPHLNGDPARARAEHLRCILMDNDSMRAYIKQLDFSAWRCSRPFARNKPV